MSINTVKAYPNWLHYLSTVDSTNIYATALLEDGLAQHGDVVWALDQTAGRGQRGKKWETKPGDNIMMSLIVHPNKALAEFPAHLNIIVAATLVRYFNTLYPYWKVSVKWPNDIYINDKKAVGVLVENVFRGMNWMHAIIGIGINVNQSGFPAELPNATSLKVASGQSFDLFELINDIRTGMLNELIYYSPARFLNTLQTYNEYLYLRGERILFTHLKDQKDFYALVKAVSADGMLVLETADGQESTYAFGTLQWHLPAQ
ncbi:biotin--[acetyl-CoA-carboxylase] ligase [Taibaiella sp. KBW10]|uniref:biotin--[acetyl-CoA-carboxylase] ligase n=1 Tax=Taibaiella sp. KBW10 TaxID=2153357 RepID=UPI00131515CA|nr:biotin--[acetyl-CoA-carboxylase] ligase [Taibaiella sp. KBW10]